VKIGVPTEVKNHEYRVSLTPAGADKLVAAGHQVLVQAGAGANSGFEDGAFAAVGAEVVADAEGVFAGSDMVVKVKEPQPQEYGLLREGQLLFTYLHLAAERELTGAMLECGASCFAYETLEVGGGLPLLTPMSEVAGRLSIQEGAKYLEKPMGGLGVLLGGVPGVPRAQVVILGGGVVGAHAARMACGLGADVTLFDLDVDRLRYLDEVMPRNCRTVFSTPMAIREHLETADLIVGAVLVPGAKAPKLVRRSDLKRMQTGSVIVDVAVDQGGCVETTRPTTHEEPTFVVDGVVHYCVANMPGAVPRTSTLALTNVTLDWTLRLANLGARAAINESEPLRKAANVIAGQLTCRGVAEAFEMRLVPAAEAVRALP
jgi:alanine dehydrogenase